MVLKIPICLSIMEFWIPCFLTKQTQWWWETSTLKKLWWNWGGWKELLEEVGWMQNSGTEFRGFSFLFLHFNKFCLFFFSLFFLANSSNAKKASTSQQKRTIKIILVHKNNYFKQLLTFVWIGLTLYTLLITNILSLFVLFFLSFWLFTILGDFLFLLVQTICNSIILLYLTLNLALFRAIKVVVTQDPVHLLVEDRSQVNMFVGEIYVYCYYYLHLCCLKFLP